MNIGKTFKEAEKYKPVSFMWPLFLPAILIGWIYLSIGNWVAKNLLK